MVLAQIDISGRINEWDKHTFLGYATESKNHIVYIDIKTKKDLRLKYGKITDFVEKFHCLMIYYCIRDHLDNFDSLQICRDCGSAKITKYLNDYFWGSTKYSRLKPFVKPVGNSSRIHKLLKEMRKENSYDLKITAGMIANKIK
ncbi:MAG: hypothetical protein V1702_05580 [Candidatus Woesearchaeota archaeon]